MISFWFLSDCPLSVLWLLSDCSLIALCFLSVFSLFPLCFLPKCSLSVQAFKIIFYFVGWNNFCWMLLSGYIANYFDGNYRNITFYFPTKASQNNTLLSKLILPKQKRVKEGHKSCECRFLFTTLPNIYSPHISVKCGVSTFYNHSGAGVVWTKTAKGERNATDAFIQKYLLIHNFKF